MKSTIAVAEKERERERLYFDLMSTEAYVHPRTKKKRIRKEAILF